MRTISFRGKRIDNGEWIYGYVFKYWEQVFIQWGIANGIPNMVEVNPKTVSEFTGRYDKNGKYIYEGDVMKSHFSNINILDDIQVVKWNEQNAAFEAEDLANVNDRLGKLHPIWWNRNCEIIGDIYENPNLIKEKK